jgi:hypothetical protein
MSALRIATTVALVTVVQEPGKSLAPVPQPAASQPAPRAAPGPTCSCHWTRPLPNPGSRPNRHIPYPSPHSSHTSHQPPHKSRMSPLLPCPHYCPGLLVPLLLLQLAFLCRSMLGLLLLFPSCLVSFSLLTHIRFSLLENNLHQNVAQKRSLEDQLQGIVAARVGQRLHPAVGHGTLLALGREPRCECFLGVRRLTICPATHITRGSSGATCPAAPIRPIPPGDTGPAVRSP